MNNIPQLPEYLAKDCKRIGFAPLTTWLQENKITLSKGSNFHDSLALSIEEKALSEEQLNQAVAELDENSDKKIFLLNLQQFKDLASEKKNLLKTWQLKYSIKPTTKLWTNGKVSSGNPTFISLFWDDELIKIKYSEIQYTAEIDYDTNNVVRTEKRVNVIYLIDPKDGFTQVRMDSAGNIHKHKNDSKKTSEAAYERFYKQLLLDLFPDFQFKDYSLVAVANKIALVEKDRFRMNKGTTTITNNAKQTFATASIQGDVRDLPEYSAAASNGTDLWLAEDLSGYWVALESGGELNKDLFMRIYRKNAQLRVQRGCLARELNYGINTIREIQKSV